jgi:hypothetical protein
MTSRNNTSGSLRALFGYFGVGVTHQSFQLLIECFYCFEYAVHTIYFVICRSWQAWALVSVVLSSNKPQQRMMRFFMLL